MTVLQKGWENGVQSDWETQPDDPCNVPFALTHLKEPGKNRYIDMTLSDLAGIGQGNDIESVSVWWDDESEEISHEEDISKFIEDDGRIAVHKMSIDYFRQKIVRHFNIAFQKHEVQWPWQLKHMKNLKWIMPKISSVGLKLTN